MTTRVALLALFIGGCLGGKRPNYQYYVLTTAGHEPSPKQSEATPGRALAIDQVTLPGYLEREQIATRTMDHQVVYSTTDRWAEPLDQAFERTLREYLATRLASTGIDVQSRGGAPTYDLRVDIIRFERTGNDRVELWARWTLRSSTGVLDTGETKTTVRMAGTNSSAMAAALSDAIAEMATELSAHIKQADVVTLRERRSR